MCATIFNGRELQRTKTLAALREVDLDPRLNALLDRFVTAYKILPGQFLFPSRTGRALHLKTARQRLAKHNIPGFHSFRRHRISRLREFGVPEDIVRFWAGHEGQSVTDRYLKLSQNLELRRDWILRAGLGFTLPDIAGLPAPSTSESSKAREVSQASASAESRALIYVAQDSDLDDFFHSSPELIGGGIS